ncbi:glycosyltransferase family 2 protein [Bradyrhizobium tropiciagri]|uniref:glycosyltransferase family 2 protein n=1 Tax=Bradyrhizobium tropiciagri TaxID=312253 RepID=UPI001BA5F75F|nr:glycosyltransferase family 2 protein [Bradyrhizobium tropiciagri]MBR0900697.1 glycosyltransferase family 2 protein [Bradyrhizobium tropiciagri]
MISIVIPALNEQDAIGDTVQRVRATLEAAKLVPHEIIVVDDGSQDETGIRAAAAGARVIRHPHNAGYGHSLKDGIRDARYDLIAITDADGTYPIESLPMLVERYRNGFDMVVGARSGTHYRESLIKMPLRWILRSLVEWTASRKIPDINSGLRVFRRSTVLGYFDHLCDTFSFTTSLTLAYTMTGRFVDYVTIDYRARIGKSKVKLLRDSTRTIQYILEAAIYYNPLRIFLLMSMLVVAAAILSFSVALATQLHVFYFMGIGGMIAALFIFSLGLLAALLRQIMIKTSAERQTYEAQPLDDRRDQSPHNGGSPSAAEFDLQSNLVN